MVSITCPNQIKTDINGNPFDNVKSVGCGFEFEVALKNDGTVWVWGGSSSAGGVGSGGIIVMGTRRTKIFFVRSRCLSRITCRAE